jgi:hypothetical protein
MEIPIAESRKVYTSINMTFAVYVYMYSNIYVAIALSVVSIWAHCLLTIIAFNQNPLLGTIFIYTFYSNFLIFLILSC